MRNRQGRSGGELARSAARVGAVQSGVVLGNSLKKDTQVVNTSMMLTPAKIQLSGHFLKCSQRQAWTGAGCVSRKGSALHRIRQPAPLLTLAVQLMTNCGLVRGRWYKGHRRWSEAKRNHTTLTAYPVARMTA